jgi:YidC/Oxa1 family membrane protein insertase
MNKKSTKLILILLVTVFLTGCTQTLVGEDKKTVTYDSKIICEACENKCSADLKEYNELMAKEKLTEEESLRLNELEESNKTCDSDCEEKCALAEKNQTGQVLTSNVLCRPTNEDVIEIYSINGVDVTKLPSCDNYSLSDGKYEGLWTTVLVKPLTWLILKIGTFLNNYGLSLIVISLLIRVVMMPLTKSTAMQSENMKKAQPDIKAIESKYKDKKDQESVMNKSKETMAIYKKYGINPMSSCLFALLQIPLLFAFIEAINRTPAIFEESLFGLKLGLTPMTAIGMGQWWYIFVVIILGVVTYYSFTLNKTAAPTASNQKQMNMMNKVFIVLIIVMSFTFSTAIGIYWISSNVFTVFQNLLTDRRRKK